MSELEGSVDLMLLDEEARHSHERWEKWVAFSSSILAVLAAVTAMFAAYSANKSVIEKTDEAINMIIYQTYELEYDIIEIKNALLKSLDKPIDPEETEMLKELKRKEAEEEKIIKQKSAEAKKILHVHHILAASVTILQIAIILNSLAIISRIKKMWYLGISFGGIGTCISIWGFLAF